MKKRLLCGLLCLGLCLGSVQAGETGFQDVRENDWFAPYVSVCVDNGLMKGTGNGNFSPNGTITVAEAATIAARLRESATGDAIPDITPLPGESLPWYQKYVSYLTSNGVAVPEPSLRLSFVPKEKSNGAMEGELNDKVALVINGRGMTSNPDGYLFTAGDMVEEFEAGTRALVIGAHSPEPVQSSFGFHVILRLDPLDHPDLLGMYQEAVMNDLVDQWVAQAVVQADENVLGQIDIQSTYELYLQSLSQG